MLSMDAATAGELAEQEEREREQRTEEEGVS